MSEVVQRALVLKIPKDEPEYEKLLGKMGAIVMTAGEWVDVEFDDNLGRFEFRLGELSITTKRVLEGTANEMLWGGGWSIDGVWLDNLIVSGKRYRITIEEVPHDNT